MVLVSRCHFVFGYSDWLIYKISGIERARKIMEKIDFVYIGFIVLFYTSLKFSLVRRKKRGFDLD